MEKLIADKAENGRIVGEQERLYINVVRGLAIFLMLWGHCIQFCALDSFDFFENSVFRVIYSFHMPLFMLISGYLFFFSLEKRDLKGLLIHRTQSLLQPIIMCGIMYNVFTDLLPRILNGRILTALKLFSGSWLEDFNHFWFLWSVLAASIAVAVSYKISDKPWQQLFLLLCGIILVSLFPNWNNNIFMYPYFVIGFLYSKYKTLPLVKRLNFIKYISIPLFPVMMLFFKKEHYIYTSGLTGEEGLLHHMPVNLYRWAIGLVGCMFVLTIIEMIFKYVLPHCKVRPISKSLSLLGKNSLQVYTLSCIFLSEYLPKIYSKLIDLCGGDIFTANMSVYNYLFTPLLAVCYSAALLLLIRILKKTKISILLFGK